VDTRLLRVETSYRTDHWGLVESLRSTHARVAALVRHRGPDDPAVIAARVELAQHLAETQTIRARLDGLTPEARQRLLVVLADDQGAAV